MLSKKQIDTLKQELETRKTEITEQIDSYVSRENERESVGELSAYDNHPADLATELYEREKDFALEKHEQTELDSINAALTAIEEGTYGICQVSGKEIPFERLEAIPTALTLKEYSSDQSIPTDRPVEEEILEPAHGNEYRHYDTGDVRDYDDSFQEVARYGTSETPSDLRGDFEDYDSLYDRDADDEGFTEDYESFVATNIDGTERTIYPSKKHEQYEQALDDEGIEAPFGDVPYHQNDSYVDEDKD
ncbi:TraR/DksA C4-type zinc finger protein [Bacillus sp. B1-b2]|uniref:TraR/DksA C4-type zinc finger protein n=1 Tax=Bacillus sp. B1-b2 TaxID=2653201 RepID=UPI001262A502|nr:TraR/DksA C4-type zinc finger protein [Bacillus sp. B1-b2]KAB7666826.1 molecular chaperone DnaK [Bacillus sp. B1-b2]